MLTGGHSDGLLNTGGLYHTDLRQSGFQHPEILSVQQVTPLLHHHSVLLLIHNWLELQEQQNYCLISSVICISTESHMNPQLNPPTAAIPEVHTSFHHIATATLIALSSKPSLVPLSHLKIALGDSLSCWKRSSACLTPSSWGTGVPKRHFTTAIPKQPRDWELKLVIGCLPAALRG